MGDQTYDLKSIKLPRFAGFALRMFVALIESPATRWMLIGQLLSQGGITKLRELHIENSPTYLPLYPSPGPSRAKPPALRDLKKLRTPKGEPSAFRFPSIADYASAYRKKATTPGASW